MVEVDKIEAIANGLPVYPSDCVSKRVEGDVVLNYLIDEKGRVVRWQVVFSGDPRLLKAVKEVAGDWRFEPVRVGGRPVRAAFDLTFRFILR